MPSDIGSSVRHGAFKSWYASGRMHERGQYADGEKQGTWTEWYDDTFATRLSQGAYVAGKRHGVWTCWHNPEHTLLHGDHRSGHSGIAQLNLEMPVLNIAGYSNGVAHGDWISWHVSGQMADSMYYVDGSLNGEVRVYN
jgi:antitoxin component YwqK of YwqJK toxin-antitoxin module